MFSNVGLKACWLRDCPSFDDQEECGYNGKRNKRPAAGLYSGSKKVEQDDYMKVKRVGNVYIGRPVALWVTLLAIIATGGIRCAPAVPTLPEDHEATLALSSPAFQAGENIPVKYTCDGQNISPPLTWGDGPQGTQSFALIMDDPDAPGGVFTHWLLFNLPADSRELPEGVPHDNELVSGARQGKNSFNEIGYGGPCPPSGPAHHYRFSLYALDKHLELAAGASRQQVLDALTGHILASGLLIGMYQR